MSSDTSHVIDGLTTLSIGFESVSALTRGQHLALV